MLVSYDSEKFYTFLRNVNKVSQYLTEFNRESELAAQRIIENKTKDDHL